MSDMRAELALAVAALAFQLGACQDVAAAAPPEPAWEYRVVDGTTLQGIASWEDALVKLGEALQDPSSASAGVAEQLELALCELGKEGWELAVCYESQFVFKRRTRP